MPSTNQPRDQVSLLLQRGFSVFPIFEIGDDGRCSCGSPDCSSPGKHPRVKGGFKSATADLLQWGQWSRQWPAANIGVATNSRVFVLDVDVSPTKKGDESLQGLILHYGALPKTLTVRTGGGGEHYYFLAPLGTIIKSSAGRIAPGIDVRGEDGYVVAPSSNHISGNKYEWVDSSVDIALAPSWLVDLCVSKPPDHKYPSEVGFVEPGQRNTGFARLAGAMRRQGLNESEILAALNGINRILPVPLPDAEVGGVARSIAKYPAAIICENLTEQSVAAVLAKRLENTFNYCSVVGWSQFDDGRWCPTSEGIEVQETAKALTNDINQDFDQLHREESISDQKVRSAVRTCQRRNFIKNIIELAKSDAKVLVGHRGFDSDRNLFNVQNGTLNLTNLSLAPHNPQDLISKIAAVEFDPNALCPRFDEFLETVLPGAVGRYAMRALAYSLLGTLQLQCMFVLVGSGRNGKSTLLELMLGIFGNYGVSTEVDTFLRRNGTGENHELARLDGARIIVTSEVPNGGVLNAPLIKKFTGNDTITARRLYRSAFEYRPAGVLFMATNHLPVIDGGDYGLARRMRIIPFKNCITDQEVDPNLSYKLSAEKPGILNRLIASLVEYRSFGLAEPVEITQSTNQYIGDTDTLKSFLDEICQIDGSTQGLGAQALYDQYRMYCRASNLQPLSKPSFKRALEAKGHTTVRKSSGFVWQGVSVKAGLYSAEAL